MSQPIVETWRAPSLRGAMLRRSGVRTRLLLIVVLTAILVGVLLVTLAPASLLRSPARPLDLGDLEAMRVPGSLPGSPQSAGNPVIGEAPALEGEQARARNERALFVALGPSAAPFRFAGAVPDRLRARACLAAAMVYEAGDDAIGQLAVGQVILNRVRHPAFPDSVCGVVTQGSDRTTGCQFTFTCDGSLARTASPGVRTRAFAHADLMLDGLVFAGVGLATHYHTVDVYPWWSSQLEKMARVGPHLFFRWPGYWGSPRVFLAKGPIAEPSAGLFAQFARMSLDGTSAVDMTQDEMPMEGDSAGDGVTSPGLAARIDRRQPAAVTDPDAAIPLSRRLSSLDAVQGDRPTLLPNRAASEGGRLLRMFPEQGIFYLLLAPSSKASAHKRAAEQLCGGRSDCRVYGWWSADAAPQGTQLDAPARAALAFTFVRQPPFDKRSRPPTAMAM